MNRPVTLQERPVAPAAAETAPGSVLWRHKQQLQRPGALRDSVSCRAPATSSVGLGMKIEKDQNEDGKGPEWKVAYKAERVPQLQRPGALQERPVASAVAEAASRSVVSGHRQQLQRLVALQEPLVAAAPTEAETAPGRSSSNTNSLTRPFSPRAASQSIQKSIRKIN